MQELMRKKRKLEPDPFEDQTGRKKIVPLRRIETKPPVFFISGERAQQGFAGPYPLAVRCTISARISVHSSASER